MISLHYGQFGANIAQQLYEDSKPRAILVDIDSETIDHFIRQKPNFNLNNICRGNTNSMGEYYNTNLVEGRHLQSALIDKLR